MVTCCHLCRIRLKTNMRLLAVLALYSLTENATCVTTFKRANAENDEGNNASLVLSAAEASNGLICARHCSQLSGCRAFTYAEAILVCTLSANETSPLHNRTSETYVIQKCSTMTESTVAASSSFSTASTTVDSTMTESTVAASSPFSTASTTIDSTTTDSTDAVLSTFSTTSTTVDSTMADSTEAASFTFSTASSMVDSTTTDSTDAALSTFSTASTTVDPTMTESTVAASSTFSKASTTVDSTTTDSTDAASSTFSSASTTVDSTTTDSTDAASSTFSSASTTVDSTTTESTEAASFTFSSASTTVDSTTTDSTDAASSIFSTISTTLDQTTTESNMTVTGQYIPSGCNPEYICPTVNGNVATVTMSTCESFNIRVAPVVSTSDHNVAMDSCSGSGSRLLTILDFEKLQFFQELFMTTVCPEIGGENVWLDGSNLEADNSLYAWKTSSGQQIPMDPMFWCPGCPNTPETNHCLRLTKYYGHLLDDAPCEGGLMGLVICELL